MEYLFVPYEIALEMKLLEFDEPCFGFYNIKGKFIKDFSVTKDIIDSLGITNMELSEKICLAPTFAQCFKFFREKYNLQHCIWSGKINTVFFGHDILNIETQEFVINNSEIGGGDCDFETYEEAELACVTELINIVKKRKTMRSIKELLEVMLDNKDLFRTGLCRWSVQLYTQDVISHDELRILEEYIRSNRPPFYDNFVIFTHTIFERNTPESHYYWKDGEIKPRLKWIKKHIAKNS